jgi:FtsZ-binding cell division protein ZapB
MIRVKEQELQDTLRLKNMEIEEINRSKGALISELSDKLNQAQKDRVKVEEERLASQIKWEAEIKRLNGDLSDHQSRYSRERI